MSVRYDESIPCLRPPKLYMWSREVLFLGTGTARQQRRRSTQEKLVLALNGKLRLRTPRGGVATTRSCVVPAGLWIDRSCVDANDAVVAIYYLAPFAQDYAAMRSVMKAALPGIYYDHPNERALVEAATGVRDRKRTPPARAREIIREAMLPPGLANRRFRAFDRRAVHVARRIRETLFDGIALAELAAEVNLSGSRLEKLFKEQAGLPITQYRMRYRLFLASILMALGHSMTDAALGAGFSNSAHLSRSYRALNGITPSAVFSRRPYIDAVIDDSALALVAGITEGNVAV
ncbi:helix-turn-helix transcriptional regulator [Ectothiorhodospiraceae bacterium WFHF3C12]|nr:helix-turn-helix transcriptional regulator [Ectothiorhodospiraceae bacterium WFHF3C12]